MALNQSGRAGWELLLGKAQWGLPGHNLEHEAADVSRSGKYPTLGHEYPGGISTLFSEVLMNRTVIAAAFIGLGAGLALGYVISHSEARADAQVKGPAWEYKVVAFRGANSTKVIERDGEKLNELANEGWEYVGPISSYSKTTEGGDVDSFGIVAFRRPKK
jgi:hypothetical protein